MRRRIWLAEAEPLAVALDRHGGWVAARLAERVRREAEVRERQPSSGNRWASAFTFVASPGEETELVREALGALRARQEPAARDWPRGLPR